MNRLEILYIYKQIKYQALNTKIMQNYIIELKNALSSANTDDIDGALRLTFSACFFTASTDFERTATELLDLVASSYLHPSTVLPLVSAAASTGSLANLLYPSTLLTFSLLPLIFASCIAQFVLANCLNTCLIQNLYSAIQLDGGHEIYIS